MRQWFPFTDYDFFAHMFCGALLLAGIDYGFNSSQILNKVDWPPLQVVVGIAIIYTSGLIIAQLSSFLIERGISEKFLHPIILLQLGARKARRREKLILLPFASRECRVSDAAKQHSQLLSTSDDDDANAAANQLFQKCLAKSLSTEAIRNRLSIFQNQYGLSRNLSFTFFALSILILISKSDHANFLSVISICLAVSMLGRFFKFYAAYSREAFRSLD